MQTGYCAACGELFGWDKPGRRKYCDKCKALPEKKRHEMIEQRMKESEAVAYDELMRRRRRADPFDLSWKSLARVDAEAKLFGMTYGTYTAACRCGFIRTILKNKGIKNPVKMLRELEEKNHG